MKKRMLSGTVALGLSLALSGAAHAGSYVSSGTPSYPVLLVDQTATANWPAGTWNWYNDSKQLNGLVAPTRYWSWQPTPGVIYDPAPTSDVNFTFKGESSGTQLAVTINNGTGTGSAKVVFQASGNTDPNAQPVIFEIPTTNVNQTKPVTPHFFIRKLTSHGGQNISAMFGVTIGGNLAATVGSAGSNVTAKSGANKFETISIELD